MNYFTFAWAVEDREQCKPFVDGAGAVIFMTDPGAFELAEVLSKQRPIYLVEREESATGKIVGIAFYKDGRGHGCVI